MTALSGGSFDHEKIAMNIAGPLSAAMDRRGCDTLAGGMLVKAADRDGMATAPDVVVRCGPPLGRRRHVDDPVAVVEVLSPSTMDYDRGFKLTFYKSIPSLRHIALVYQEERRIEAWDRADAGWTYRVSTAPDAVLASAVLDWSLPLTAVYRGTRLAA